MSVQPLSPSIPTISSTDTMIGAGLAPPPISQRDRQICRLVRQMAFEMFTLISGEAQRRDRRHAMNHIRQIAIYVCHVGLSMPVAMVAQGFGRDGATVRTTCLLVEERRENAGFDDFISAIERLAGSLWELVKGEGDVIGH